LWEATAGRAVAVKVKLAASVADAVDGAREESGFGAEISLPTDMA
jgi:hypothetical protein